MTKRPNTDLHELVKGEVSSHMKPFIEVIMEEHEETRRSFKKLEALVVRMGESRIHCVINSILIAVVFIGVVVLFSL